MKQVITGTPYKGLALAMGLSFALAGNVYAGGGITMVTNGNDSGPGSLREALATGTRIKIDKKVGTIHILSTLEYNGMESLSIKGKGQTVAIAHNATLLAVTQGADLKIDDLNFAGPGGFSLENRGDLDAMAPAGKGIFVDLRDDQSGKIEIDLKRVKVSGVANHGIHISDCSLADACGSGGGGAGDGSPASIEVKLDRVVIHDVGNGKFDADGLRVDERGEGDIKANIRRSAFTFVGADGVELDEGDRGDVIVDVRDSDFSDNGNYCQPNIIGPFVPAQDEAEFDDMVAVAEEDSPIPLPDPAVVVIPGPVFGSADDGCLERAVDFYDSGYVEAYEIAIDLDDGFDIDESGAGSLIAQIKGATIHRNLDEGLDFDEADEGLISVDLNRSVASQNRDDGFKVSEEDEGSVIGKVRHVSSVDNGGKGIVFEEENEGDLLLRIVRTNTANNDDSDDTGVEAAQESPGTGLLKLKKSDIEDGVDLDGVDQI